ncbi:biopolymer transporter ExbD [Kiloniella antarctica]|uniref:Biopolymer transporter ExbD n=1 Tax=Kiloniella antarctica TaxID=1550907 RepID=A0ABW5BN94_9PROT
MIELSTDQTSEGDSIMPDLTPMLDVLFILLVFLILTANSANFSIEVDLPQPQETVLEQASSDAITITLRDPEYDGASVWELDGRAFLKWQDMRPALQSTLQQAPDQSVVIAGDKSASIENLVQVLSFLETQGRTAAEILLEP